MLFLNRKKSFWRGSSRVHAGLSTRRIRIDSHRPVAKVVVYLAGAILSVLATRVSAQEADVKDLPLIEVVAKEPSHTMAVFLSGDGGWAAIDKAIAGALQKHGVSIVGINSLKYFWRTRTP